VKAGSSGSLLAILASFAASFALGGFACSGSEPVDPATGGSDGRGGSRGSAGATAIGGAPGWAGAGTGGGAVAAFGGRGGAGAGTRGLAGSGGAVTGGSGGSAAADPLNDPSVCTSSMMWTGGTDQNMTPGDICGQCHSNFKIAGTVFPTGHEPDFCDGVNGSASDLTVVVTDAANRVLTLRPNTVGNFYTTAAMTPPYHAKVVASGKERAMVAAQTTGICNSCHTQDGTNLAPGRITLPF
jgi:hypothetical protein